MSVKPDLQPRLRIKGQALITWGQVANPKTRQKNEYSFGGEKRPEKPYSLFSKKSRKLLNNTLQNWIDTVTLSRSLLKEKRLKPVHKFTFTTLTLPSEQMHCDKSIKRESFNKFLIDLKREYQVNHYIWKAEPQKNGNLHFHILMPNYIDAIELRLLWLCSINSLGYVNRFYSKFKTFLPNATDIHVLEKINDVASYVGKYMKKDEAFRPICGHTWGRSDSLNKLLPLTLDSDFETDEWINIQLNSIEHSESHGEMWSYFKLKKRMNLTTLPPHQKKRLAAILDFNRNVLLGTFNR